MLGSSMSDDFPLPCGAAVWRSPSEFVAGRPGTERRSNRTLSANMARTNATFSLRSAIVATRSWLRVRIHITSSPRPQYVFWSTALVILTSPKPDDDERRTAILYTVCRRRSTTINGSGQDRQHHGKFDDAPRARNCLKTMRF